MLRFLRLLSTIINRRCHGPDAQSLEYAPGCQRARSVSMQTRQPPPFPTLAPARTSAAAPQRASNVQTLRFSRRTCAIGAAQPRRAALQPFFPCRTLWLFWPPGARTRAWAACCVPRPRVRAPGPRVTSRGRAGHAPTPRLSLFSVFASRLKASVTPRIGSGGACGTPARREAAACAGASAIASSAQLPAAVGGCVWGGREGRPVRAGNCGSGRGRLVPCVGSVPCPSASFSSCSTITASTNTCGRRRSGSA